MCVCVRTCVCVGGGGGERKRETGGLPDAAALLLACETCGCSQVRVPGAGSLGRCVGGFFCLCLG